MSLFKQIALSIALFLSVVLGTVLFLNFQSSQKFIQDQLYSSAEDTAASLALALGGILTKESSEAELLTEMETMIAAIFDRGYYASIRLKSEDKVLISKEQDLAVKDVPQWFLDHVEIRAKAANSDISGGWSVFGTIWVTGHVGHAYVQLWEIFVDLVGTFVMMALVFLVLFGVVLKIVLHSLKDVENQAKAIEEHNFYVNEKLPFTTEFRYVVRAMNSMVGKVKIIFDKEAESLKKYYELLYSDATTKLYNRRYLMTQLSSALTADSDHSQGSFVLFSFEDLEAAKKVVGYVALENLLVLLAEMLQQQADSSKDGMAIRMNSSDFALFLPHVKPSEIEDDLQTMIDRMQKLFEDLSVSKELCVSAGAIVYTHEDDPKSIFSRADFELSKAKVKQTSVIEYGPQTVQKGVVLGKEEWTEMFNTSLEENMLKVAAQRVISIENKTVLHQELFLRMVDQEGTVHNAGYFMPVLANLNLSDEVDKHVVNLALHYIERATLTTSVAINIGAGFLKDSNNVSWLVEKLIKYLKTSSAIKLNFEATRFAVMANVEIFARFSKLLKRHGAGFGIDNFSIDAQGLGYLKEVNPDYIKADCSFFLDLKDDENATASESLSIITESLGISLIATAVEDKETITKLKAFDVHYIQGSVVNTPEMLGV